MLVRLPVLYHDNASSHPALFLFNSMIFAELSILPKSVIKWRELIPDGSHTHVASAQIMHRSQLHNA